MFRTATRTRISLGSVLFPAILALAAAHPASAQSRQWSQESLVFGQDINNQGTTIGFGPQGAFIKERSGGYQTFSVPGAAFTSLGGINGTGAMTGTCYSEEFLAFAFVRTADGRSQILPRIDGMDTTGDRITDNGQVIGNIAEYDPETGETLVQRGVVIDTRRGNSVTYFDYPGRSFTYLTSGNAQGLAIGWAMNADGTGGVWFTVKDGVYAPFEFPAGSLGGGLVDVNERGQVAGSYVTPDHVFHTFIRDPDGRVTTLDYPGLPALMAATMPAQLRFAGQTLYRMESASATSPSGFDERGDVVGSLAVGYADANGQFRYYISARLGFVSRVGR